MHYVFISYARRDGAVVEALVRELERRSVPIWIDRRDIPVSLPWLNEIKAAITAADLVAVCHSDHWFASSICRSELQTAQQQATDILEVDLRQTAALEAATRIEHALACLGAEVRRRTELAVRAATWDSAGRKRRDLVGGRRLRRMRRVRGWPEGAPPPTVQRFLSASRRRQRRRRAIAAAGLLALLLANQLINALDKEETSRSASLVAAEQQLFDDSIVDLPGSSAYSRLDAAAAMVNPHAPDAYRPDARLTRALQIPLPDTAIRVLRGAAMVSAEPTGRPRVVASAGARGSADGRVVARLSGGHLRVGSVKTDCPGRLRYAAVALDGRTAAGAGGRRVCIVNIRTGRAATIRLPGRATAVAASSGGAVVGMADGRVQRFGARGSVLVDSGPPVSQVAIAGRRVAVAGPQTGVVLVFSGGRLYRRLIADRPPKALALSPDGRQVAASVGDEVRVLDIDTQSSGVLLEGAGQPVGQIAWSRSGSALWGLVGRMHAVRWRLRSGTTVVDDPHAWFAAASSFAPDGTAMVAGRDGDVLLIDARGHLRRRWATSARSVLWSARSEAGHAAVLSGGNGFTVVDLTTGRDRRLPVANCPDGDPAYSRDGRLIYVACPAGPLLALESATGRRVWAAQIPDEGAFSVTVAPSGAIYVGGENGSLVEVDPRSHRASVLHDAGSHPVFAVAVSADGGMVAAVGGGVRGAGSASIRIRDAAGRWQTDSMLFEDLLATQARSAAFSPDGRLLAVGFADGSVRVFTVPAVDPGRTILETPGTVRGLAFTADSRRLLIATRDGVVAITPACSYCRSLQDKVAEARRRVRRGQELGLSSWPVGRAARVLHLDSSGVTGSPASVP